MGRPFELAAVAGMAEEAANGHHPEPLTVQLRDGSHALLRPVRAEDRQRLVDGFALLSPTSRYLRFHDDVRGLTEDQLRCLMDVDHRDHGSWIALDAAHPDVAGMGEARYVRLPHAPDVAEFAVTVVDHYQGRGLGTLLLAVLAEAARANGITVFRNYVLADNTEMLELFDQLGAARQRCGPGVYEVDCPLPEDPDQLPDTPAGRAIRAFAQEPDLRARFTSALVPLWIERLRRRNDGPQPPPDDTSPYGRESRLLAEWLDVALDDQDGDSSRRPSTGRTDGRGTPPAATPRAR